MRESVHQCAKQPQLDALTLYLFGDREGIVESAEDACRRLVDSMNAFFGTREFSVADGPRDSLRIGCACGWSLSLLLSADLKAPLAECLGQMVLHHELWHSGLTKSEPWPRALAMPDQTFSASAVKLLSSRRTNWILAIAFLILGALVIYCLVSPHPVIVHNGRSTPELVPNPFPEPFPVPQQP